MPPAPAPSDGTPDSNSRSDGCAAKAPHISFGRKVGVVSDFFVGFGWFCLVLWLVSVGFGWFWLVLVGFVGLCVEVRLTLDMSFLNLRMSCMI